MKNTVTNEKYMCPVCGQYEFKEIGSDDICEVCGWHDEPIQAMNPDEECCANQMSLNRAKRAWLKGKPVE